MSPLDAVAAAIRERLLAGNPAPLLGLGTLVRQHVAARVQEKADGTRVMMPPGETIALGPSSADEAPLAPSFARFRALPADQAADAYQDAIDQIEALLSATGEVRLPGVGLLRRTSSGVVLGVEAELLAAVNRRYEGLAPVPTTPAEAAAPAPPSPTGTPETSAASSESEASDPTERAPRTQRPGLPSIETVPPSEDDVPGDAAPEAGTVDASPDEDAPPPSTEADTDEEETETPPIRDDEDVEAMAPTVLEDDLAEASDDVPPPPFGRAAFGMPEAPEAPAPDDASANVTGDDSAEVDGTEAADEPEADTETIEEAAAEEEAAEEATIEEAPSDPEAEADAPETDPAEDPEAEAPPLMAPFGAPDAPPLSDVLPPSDPAPEEDAAHDGPAPASPDDEWERETWTAPTFDDAPTFDPDRASDTDLVDAVIEDADFDIVPPPTAAPDALAASPDLASDAEHDTPPVLSVPPMSAEADPAAEMESDAPALVLDAPPEATKPAVAAPRTVAEQDRSWLLWLVLVFVLVALAVAAIWFWPEIRSRARLLTGPDETITVDARPVDAGPADLTDAGNGAETLPRALDGVDVSDGALIQSAVPDASPLDDALVDATAPFDPAGASRPRRTVRTPPEAAPKPPISPRVLPSDDDPPAPPTGLGESPAPGVALLPPRVSGLDDRLVDALAARDGRVDPAADAWTFVVLSTPSRAEAETLRDRYRRAGYRSSVLTSRGGQFRVCVGQFASRDDVFRLRDRLPPQAPADTWALYLQTL